MPASTAPSGSKAKVVKKGAPSEAVSHYTVASPPRAGPAPKSVEPEDESDNISVTQKRKRAIEDEDEEQDEDEEYEEDEYGREVLVVKRDKGKDREIDPFSPRKVVREQVLELALDRAIGLVPQAEVSSILSCFVTHADYFCLKPETEAEKVPRLERKICRLRRDYGNLEVNVLKKMSRIYDLQASCALRAKENVKLKLKIKKRKVRKLQSDVHDARENDARVRLDRDRDSDDDSDAWSDGMAASSSVSSSSSGSSSNSVGTSVSRR